MKQKSRSIMLRLLFEIGVASGEVHSRRGFG
jgi:hypothetical protein